MKHYEVPAKLASANALLRACRKTLAAATSLSSTMTHGFGRYAASCSMMLLAHGHTAETRRTN